MIRTVSIVPAILSANKQEYKDQITDADEDDEALNGVREYLESLSGADNEDDL